MIFIRLTDEQLEKARKSPRLVPKRITVNGPTGPYQRTVWVLPDQAKKMESRGAQFDLFDEPPAAAQFDLFDDGRPAAGEPVKSKGHLAFYDAGGKQKEVYQAENGDIYTAQMDDVVDTMTGNRIGRWEGPAHAKDATLSKLGVKLSKESPLAAGPKKRPSGTLIENGNGGDRNGHVIQDEAGGEWIVMASRSWAITANPIVNGKPEINAETKKVFRLDSDKVYDTGKRWDHEQKKAVARTAPEKKTVPVVPVKPEAKPATAEKESAKDSPKVGATKTENGVTYRLNENGRWERVDEEEKKPRAAKPDSGDDLDPSSENYRFRDTGYIAGSRKELAAERIKEAVEKGQLVRKADLDWEEVEKNPRRAKTLIVKSNLFGKVPWDQLKENGMEPGAGFLIDRVYASIAAEPEDSAAKRQDYAYGIESIRDRMEACKTVDDVLGVLKEIGAEIQGEVLSAAESDAYKAAYEKYSAMRKDFAAIKAVHEELVKDWNLINHEINSATWEQSKRERRGWKPDPALTARIAELEKQQKAASKKADEYKAKYPDYFDTEKRDLGGGRITYASTKEMEYRKFSDEMDRIKQTAIAVNLLSNPVTRAWQALGQKFWNAINYRSYKGSDAFGNHVASARAGRIKDWSWMEKDRPAGKKPTKESVRFQLKVAEKFERTGGRKVSVDSTMALKEMFGLRDVQSGNWVLQDVNSAKFHTERSAAALADMADILGIPDGQVSLNGRLALAFGARGTGSSGWKKGAAKAHYEPVERVINITKMGGGGSLGHEWFHAFDNMLSEAMGMTNADTEFMLTERVSQIPDPDVRSAFSGLLRAMTEGDIVPKKTIAYTARDVAASRGVDRMNYGLYADIKKAGSLQAAVEAIAGKYARYDEADGDKHTKKAIRQRNEWMAVAAAYYDKKPEGGAVEVKTGRPHSAFMEGAKDLDGDDKKAYWSTTREMAARAFQAYCEDRLADRGQRNDYLSVFADNKYHRDPLFGVEWKPYPEGEERKHINAAFDKLFEVVRSKNLIQKAIDAENRRMVKAIRVWRFGR